jgi:uncharacterized protein YcnI
MRILLIGASLLAFALPAAAHVTLDTREAPAGTTLRAAFRVPHGCEGAAMTRMRVRIPDGVTAVKPMPKAGWELATVKGPLAVPVSDGHGGTVTEGVREVTWTGRLLDEHYDEFVVRFALPDRPGQTLAFPVVQECEGGKVARWIDVPAAGQKADDLREPAPLLRLVARP